MNSEDIDVVTGLDDWTADQLEPIEDHTQDELLDDPSHVEATEDHAQDSPEETDTAAPQVEEKREKLVKLPMAKVKSIIKSDPDVNMVNLEAVFIIAKSTEMFIDSMAKESYKFTVQSKKKTVQKKDVERAVDNVDALAFLEGMIDNL